MDTKIEMSDRLRMIIDSTQWNDSEFAKRMKVKKYQISDWVNGRAPIPVPRIQRILEIVPYIDGRWFITGEGNMYREGVSVDNADETMCKDPNCIRLIEKLNETIKTQAAQIAASDKVIIQLQAEKIEWLQEKK